MISLAAVALLVGCTSVQAPSASPLATTSPAGEASPSPAAAFPKTVKHALGTTEIPAPPERIVVLNHYSLLDYLLALNVPPIGSTGDPASDYPFASYLEGRTEGVEMVGGGEEPNLEQIAALAPDLILANPWQEDIYAELSEIGPTVGVPLSYSDYLTEFRWVAHLIGRTDAAEDLIADHEARIAEVEELLSNRAGELELSAVRIFPDSARVEGDSYVTTLLRSAGFALSPVHADPAGAELSLERIPELDADAIVVYSAANAQLEADNAAAREEWLDSPLWDNLAAAQADQVYVVDSFLWAGGGFVWAEAMLDDLEQLLRTEDPQPID
ncbi:MAG: ABC transporter substrate-binding protein [Candidatus Limnocylindria bacterium]